MLVSARVLSCNPSLTPGRYLPFSLAGLRVLHPCACLPPWCLPLRAGRGPNVSGVSANLSDASSDDSDPGRWPDHTENTPYGATSRVEARGDKSFQVQQLTLSSVKAQAAIAEEVEHSREDPHRRTPHLSTAPETVLAVPPPMAQSTAASFDESLLDLGFKSITSNGKAGLVPATLAANRSVVMHNTKTLIDVQCESTRTGQRLGEPWDEAGKLNSEYVKNKGQLNETAMTFHDKPMTRTNMVLQADADVEKLHTARILHNTAPVDFKTILNDGESVVMQLRCKGMHGIPSTGGDIVGDCWLILTRMQVGQEEYRRVYFYQSAHASKAYDVEEGERDYQCCCAVHRDSTIKLSATRTETAYLDVVTVEDQLVHAHYEQVKRTTVQKINKTQGQYVRPACLRDCVGNCPECSLDLCQATEHNHCTIPICCCISCVVPSILRPGYAKLSGGSSQPPASLAKVITHESSMKTEKIEDAVGPGDEPMTNNRMEATNVQLSDFYAISLQFAFPNRSKLKECIAIVCPSEPVSKALKFVMLISQRPNLYDCPATQTEFRKLPSRTTAALRRSAKGEPDPPIHHDVCERFTLGLHRLFCPWHPSHDH